MNNNLKPVTHAPKSDKQISNVLRKSKSSKLKNPSLIRSLFFLVVNNTELNGLPQSHIHYSLPMPAAQESLMSSSNSFGDSYSPLDEPSKPKNLIPTISESDESCDDYKRKFSTKL